MSKPCIQKSSTREFPAVHNTDIRAVDGKPIALRTSKVIHFLAIHEITFREKAYPPNSFNRQDKQKPGRTVHTLNTTVRWTTERVRFLCLLKPQGAKRAQRSELSVQPVKLVGKALRK